MTISTPRSIALAALAVAFGVPTWASAGTTITAHQVSMKLNTVTQMTTNKGDGKQDKTTVNQKDLFIACVGTAPTKTEGIFVFFDCAGPPPGRGEIKAINTSPLTDLADIGTITFGTPLVRTTKGGGTTITSIKLPATLEIDCGGAASAELSGTLNVSYSAFPNGGPVCPSSGSMKFTGSAAAGGQNFIIDDGSNVKINKRNGGITVDPVLP
ncbi:MAG TPA: hypothetical protein VEI82_07480 [Myxococcota bacterium]|nr:hypothetical protein [Myxococcota bacterium]